MLKKKIKNYEIIMPHSRNPCACMHVSIVHLYITDQKKEGVKCIFLSFCSHEVKAKGVKTWDGFGKENSVPFFSVPKKP